MIRSLLAAVLAVLAAPAFGQTLPTPSFSSLSISSGGTFNGNFGGTPTFSGAVTLSGGGSLSGTFSGTPTFSGAITLSAGGTALSVTNAATVGGTFTAGGSTGVVVIGTDSNGQLSLGSKTLAKTPFIDWFSTGTSSSGFRIISTGNNNLTFQAGATTNVGSFTSTGFSTPTLTLNQTKVWSGATNSPTFSSLVTVSGSTTASQPYVYNIDVEDSISISTHSTGFRLIDDYGGGSTTGGKTGMDVTLVQQNGATTDSAADNYYVAFNSSVFARNSPPGSTSTSPVGRIFGFSSSSQIQTGFTATNYYQVAGGEFDVAISSGSTAAIRSGLTIADLNGTAQGFWGDDMIWLYGAGQTWRYGIMFGDLQPWPMDGTNGTMIGSRMGSGNNAASPYSTKWGVDFNQVRFPSTGNPYDGGFVRSNGISIDGAGTIQQGSCYRSWASTGAIVDCKGSVGTSAAISVAGTGYPNGTFAVTSPYGGLWAVTASSGIPNAVSQLVAPAYPSTTPPANPVSTTSQVPNNAGSGLTLTITWNTTATILSLNPTGGVVKIGSGGLSANGTAGVSCSGTPTSSFASVGGIVTHC